jgi:hypothetical protein
VRLSRLAGLTVAGALLLALAAPASAAAGDANIRVLHASPDAPSVDVFVNDAKVDALSGVSFGEFSNGGDYVAVAPGTYSVKVCATADSTICPIGPVDLTFDADMNYTIAASDLLASIDANVFVDDPTLVADKALVRVVHLAADTPAVDVLTQDKAATIVDNLAYPDKTAYLPLDGGAYDLIVCADADNSICPLDLPEVTIANGTAYTVYAIGSLEGGDGIEGLTAAIGVDGVYQAPTVTPPATDTVAATGSTEAGDGVGVVLATLAAAAVLGTGLALRVAPARARR